MYGTSVYYGITGHSMSICVLAHENMDGALHCLHGICVRARACMVRCVCLHCAYTAANTHVCEFAIVYVHVCA
jgi:hypothetical protein